jgi:hypothetical protein
MTPEHRAKLRDLIVEITESERDDNVSDNEVLYKLQDRLIAIINGVRWPSRPPKAIKKPTVSRAFEKSRKRGSSAEITKVLPERVLNCLNNALRDRTGISYWRNIDDAPIDVVLSLTQRELGRLPNMGQKSITDFVTWREWFLEENPEYK